MVIACVLVVAAFLVAFSPMNRPASQSVTYVTNGPATSQWLVLSFLKSPLSISANNTGEIPWFPSSAALNATKIGVYCAQTLTATGAQSHITKSTAGECAKFATYQQTGWYWDPSSGTLYIHYLGGPSVKLTVSY